MAKRAKTSTKKTPAKTAKTAKPAKTAKTAKTAPAKTAASAKTAKSATQAASAKSAKPSKEAPSKKAASAKRAAPAKRVAPAKMAAPDAVRGAGGAEPSAERQGRAERIVAGLRELYPDADCELDRTSAFELLVATILSAQSTDVTVNKVTPALFARFPDAPAMADADQDELEALIRATGFFRQKAKSVLATSRRLVEAYGGEVPGRMEDLVTLPGVARKTANVVLGTWFRENAGIVVDTHVGRLAHRLGLTWSSKGEKDAVRIEQDLMQVVPRAEWTFFAHALILHGRRVCTARKPACAACALARDCPSAFSFG